MKVLSNSVIFDPSTKHFRRAYYMSDILLGTRDTQEREARVWPQDDHSLALEDAGAKQDACPGGGMRFRLVHRSPEAQEPWSSRTTFMSLWATCEEVQDSLKGPASPMQGQHALCMANPAHPQKENKRDPDNKAMRTQSWGRI